MTENIGTAKALVPVSTGVTYDTGIFKVPEVPTNKRKKKKVLTEEKYIKKVEEIIERDFYPDINGLREKLEGRPDADNSFEQSPTTFDTPSSDIMNFTPGHKKDFKTMRSGGSSTESTTSDLRGLSLDQFMAKYTSEDNESFEHSMEEKEKRFRINNPWLFETEEKHNQSYVPNLALPSVEEQKKAKILAVTGKADDANDTRPKSIENWTYKTYNPLMFVPDAVPPSEQQLIERAKMKKQEVKTDNTRFEEAPFSEVINSVAMLEASAIQAYKKEGKVGVDGKELRETMYGLCPAPSPRPGVDASPLMTWGQIEGTPIQMEGSQTPLVKKSGPAYRIPKASERDVILKTLTDKVSEEQRDKKNKALNAAKSRLKSPSSKRSASSLSTLDRISTMSPAAQRLFSHKFGLKSGRLGSSYTPSPRLTPTLGGKSSATPKGLSGVLSQRSSSVRSIEASSPLGVSLTDNLLNLPTKSSDT